LVWCDCFVVLEGLEILIKRVVIENFKSLEHVELDLRPGINLLVGPNAGGKSNLLEALYFLRLALVDGLRSVPYMPYVPHYWDPLDVVFMRDLSRTIRYQLDFLCRNPGKGVEHDVSLGVSFRVPPDRSTILPTEITISYGGDSVLLISEGGVEVKVRENLFTEVKDHFKDDPNFSSFFEKFKIVGRARGYLTFRADPGLWVDLGTNLVLGVMRVIFPIPASMGFVGVEGIGSATLYLPPVGWVPLIFKVRPALKEVTKGFESPYPFPVATILDLLTALSHVVMLKHPDMRALREPQTLGEAEKLDVRASNLAPVLLSLMSKGKLSRIEEAITELFPGTRIRPQPQHGRVALLVEEGGVELPPPNVADGLLKVLAILAAVELGPSLLLIDELENSLHARLIEYVVDVLNSLDVPVLVATHSPAVVDLVGPERTIVVERGEGGGTRVSRIKDPEGLSRKLRELGVTFSDYVMYRATWWGDGNEAPPS